MNQNIITIDGQTIYLVEGLSLSSPKKVVQYGLRKEDLGAYIGRKQLSQFAQFYGLVLGGLILSKHCFNGLNRNLHCDDNSNGELSKFALSRKPAYDYTWQNNSASGIPLKQVAPTKKVFVVLISRNDNHQDTFPNIEGWIDRWSWVPEDEGSLAEAPKDWVGRYETKVWSI